jgi:hypothetical protein
MLSPLISSCTRLASQQSHAAAAAAAAALIVIEARCLMLCCLTAAGALPDQIEFSKSCRTILVSNEGEPDCYDAPTCTDPEGSVSVINLRLGYTSSNGKRCNGPRSAAAAAGDADAATTATFYRQCSLSSVTGTVRTAGFSAWNDKKSLLLSQGILLDAPNGASVAQDLEPEYTTFSADERIAFVSIQVRVGGVHDPALATAAAAAAAAVFAGKHILKLHVAAM